jgi:hypothetical protein
VKLNGTRRTRKQAGESCRNRNYRTPDHSGEGTCRTKSPDYTGRYARSGSVGISKGLNPAGNKKKAGTDKKPVIPHPVNEVKRKTELQGMSTKSSPEGPTQARKRTERDLKDPEFGIPYAKTEKAVRNLVCSLIERQNRMNADIFLEINSMNEDIGMLKDQVYKIKTMKTGTPAGAKK